jgi:hypothetical protein
MAPTVSNLSGFPLSVRAASKSCQRVASRPPIVLVGIGTSTIVESAAGITLLGPADRRNVVFSAVEKDGGAPMDAPNSPRPMPTNFRTSSVDHIPLAVLHIGEAAPIAVDPPLMFWPPVVGKRLKFTTFAPPTCRKRPSIHPASITHLPNGQNARSRRNLRTLDGNERPPPLLRRNGYYRQSIETVPL